MKSYEEVTHTLLERRDQYVTEQNRKRKKLIGTVASLCCLAALISLSIWQSGLHQRKTPAVSDNFIVGDRVEQLTNVHKEPSQNPNPPEQPEHEIRILEVENIPETPQKMYIALMMDDFIPMDHEEINAYYGVNIFPIVPGDLESHDHHALGIFKRKTNGEVYHDSNKISYTNTDYSRGIAVNVDKNGLRFDFCNWFALIEKRSVINGVEVGIAQTPTGELYAEFTVQNVGFRIYSYGLEQDEFISVIESLLK